MNPSSPTVLKRTAGDAMKNKKVLVIDDQKDFGFLMESFFSKKGCKVFVAYTISEGLRVLHEQAPDFTFLDNNMPDGFGWSKTDFIVANYPETKLILISAMEVPKAASTSYRILHKSLLKDELNKMFP